MIRDALVLSGTLLAVSVAARLATDSRQSLGALAHDLVERSLRWRLVAEGPECTPLDRVVHLVRAHALLDATRALLSDRELERAVHQDVPRLLHETERAIVRARQNVTPPEPPVPSPKK